MGILTEDAACNLRGDILMVTLFVIVIFVYIGVIPLRNERHSYRSLNKVAFICKGRQLLIEGMYKKSHISSLCLVQVHRKKRKNIYTTGCDCQSNQDIQYSIKMKWSQGTGIMAKDCTQPLRIGRIRGLNECAGRPFGATTLHNQIVRLKNTNLSKNVKIEVLGEKCDFDQKSRFLRSFQFFQLKLRNSFSNKIICFGTKKNGEIPCCLN